MKIEILLPDLSNFGNDHLKDSVMIGKCKQYLKEIKRQLSAVKDNNGSRRLVLDNQLINVEQFRPEATNALRSITSKRIGSERWRDGY